MRERHLLGRWKLGPGSWIELVTEGPFGAHELEKLRRYVELLEADEEQPEPGTEKKKEKENG